MSTVTPINDDGTTGILARIRARAGRMCEQASGKLCVLDARMRTLAAESDEGAATAEYAVVLVAATGFAALLVAIMKSETVRKLLLDIVKQALSIGG